jgi:predicted transcriptional regulator
VSVLWKADVYRDEAERRRQMADPLSIPDVARIFDRDLDEKRANVRFDLDRIEDPGLIAAVNSVYAEAVPIERRQSIFDAA